MDDQPSNTTIKSPELRERCRRMQEITRQREEAAVMHFPFWPEEKRGTPNSFLRSALFAAVQSKDRVYMKESVLFSQQGITIKYTGEQLNQEDLDVWEAISHLARQHPLGNECSFTAYSILKALDLPVGGCQHQRLHSAIIRLTACAVEIRHEGRVYFGSLIESGVKDEVTSHYTISINKKLNELFGNNGWTAIDWQQRLLLRRKPLAQALHAYFSSHERPYPVNLSTLQELTGSRNIQKASFKRQVKTALESMIKIGFLESYNIQDEVVTVKRIKKSPRINGQS
jgi:TrfA protein